MKQKRGIAYSLLRLKSVNEDERIIVGIATTPSPDRVGDVVEPKGAEFQLPIPLLWQHRHDQPIGEVFEAKVTADGIEVKCRVVKIDEPGKLKDRIDEAWQSLKSGLVKGLSIGFSATEYAFIESGIRFAKWLWLELSCVTIPCNGDAKIEQVRAYDFGRKKAGCKSCGDACECSPDSDSCPPNCPTCEAGCKCLQTGKAAHGRRSLPGASGPSRVTITRGASTMKTIAQRKEAFAAEKAAKEARLRELMASDIETLDAAQQEEFDTLSDEIKEIDGHLSRLDRVAEMDRTAAAPVNGRSSEDGAQSRGVTRSVIALKRELPPGVRFARMAMCVGAAKGSISDALALAQRHYPDDAGIQEVIKTAVGGATTGNGQAPLLQYTDIMTEFIDYLRPMTILGKFGTPIPGANGGVYPSPRRVPFNIRVGTQTAGASAGWVGEGKPAPLSAGTFGTATLDFAKIAAISVLTKEELRFTALSSEMKVRDDLAAAVAAKSDVDFIDPTNAGSANVKPAAVTYNVAAVAVSGTTPAAFRVDLQNMLQTMITARIQPTSIVLIMSQGIALALSLMRNSLGQREFPDLTMNGGLLEGIPVIASEHVTALGSPSTNMIVALNARDVFLADDGNVEIEASDQASLEMSDAPAQNGVTGSGAQMVSLWQTGMVGLKAVREINWKLMRAASCQYLSGVAYTNS